MSRLVYRSEDPQVRRICDRYWERDDEGNFATSVKSAAAEFGVKPGELSKRVKEWCMLQLDELTCARCERPYEVGSRSELEAAQRRIDWRVARPNLADPWICNVCQAEEAQRQAMLLRQTEAEQRAIIFREFPASRREIVNIDDLSLAEAVYLLSFIRVSAMESFEKGIIDYRETEADTRLAPTSDLYFEIIRTLVEANYIVPHPDSPLKDFVFEEDTVKRYYLRMPAWWLPIGGTSDDERGLLRLMEECFREMDWQEDWFDQVQDLWRTIALHECLEYLDLVMREHGFTFEAGDKTREVLRAVLERYSVGQAFNFIWRAAKDGAAYYMRGNVPKAQAANSVIGSIQRAADRAAAEGWDVKPFRRDRRSPQTMVSRVLFDTVLQIADEGFTTLPRAL